ncbi:MAG: hypothetical protein M3362_22755, partial [Acidobacteriota bacterium]|nr:hypothetical protein [Acidobacteriota bacterium]
MERNGEVFVQDVPVEDYIPILPVLYIGLPGYIREGRRHQTDDGSQDATVVGKAVLRSETQIDELLEKYN